MDTLVEGYSSYINQIKYNHHSIPIPPPSNRNHNKIYETSDSPPSEEGDYSDEILKYINQMLMEEEDLENKPCMFHECSALQAAEKSFYDVLGQQYPPSDTCSSISDPPGSQIPQSSTSDDGARGKKTHYLEDNDYIQEYRSNKQLASYTEDVESHMYDKVLLCAALNPDLHKDDSKISDFHEEKNRTQPKVGRPRGKKGKKKEVVDLRGLLTQCAQSVATNNVRGADEVLKKIRHHSSPYGDGTERLAHYIANAIEARFSGTGTALYSAFTTRKIMAADVLKAYQAYVTACPFHKMSNIFANKTIQKLATANSTRLHIVDFGILYGFQWPCLIQGLSMRKGGPPMLRITGIDLPQPGFRPEERVEDTGRRLANYCERFGVPFEFNAIAKKWENITLEDLKIDRDEMLVVNSLYRLRNVPDETVLANSPRDYVLGLIRQINPDMFIQGVLNGTFNAPFFVTRFREALFHFSTLFDMFEATASREDKNRLLFEQEVFGRDAMNVVACEGTARIERPETYRQWQARNVRAGFRQLPLYKDLVEEVSMKVRNRYHKDFLVDEESNWMLQGWKGRVLYALSCWKPVHE